MKVWQVRLLHCSGQEDFIDALTQESAESLLNIYRDGHVGDLRLKNGTRRVIDMGHYSMAEAYEIEVVEDDVGDPGKSFEF